jgi:hypothetical protein
MTPDEARDLVRRHYPNARAVRCGHWRILSDAPRNDHIVLSIWKPDQDSAWLNAADEINRRFLHVAGSDRDEVRLPSRCTNDTPPA